MQAATTKKLRAGGIVAFGHLRKIGRAVEAGVAGSGGGGGGAAFGSAAAFSVGDNTLGGGGFGSAAGKGFSLGSEPATVVVSGASLFAPAAPAKPPASGTLVGSTAFGSAGATASKGAANQRGTGKGAGSNQPRVGSGKGSVAAQPAWTEHRDAVGTPYFHNATDGQTTCDTAFALCFHCLGG